MKKIIVLMGIVLLAVGLSGCASWNRMTKNINSDVSNGLERDIKVYNADGKKIFEQKGKFDVKHSDHSLQYIDQQNKKHNIYMGDNTTVTVDELE
ncbi:hypothetical protein LABALGNA3A7_09630 [Dellaglioa algida]|nr:hypothetical protein LABALGNA3A7_09630 [Dellaglioa algida]